MNNIKKYFLLLLIAEMFFAYSPAFAQTQQTTAPVYNPGVDQQIGQYLCTPDTKGGGAGSGVLFQCINQIYKFAIVVAGVVGVFFIVIAGYLYISSEGNSETVEKAKSMVTSTIVSIIILLGGYLILKALNPDLIQFQSIQPQIAPGVASVTPGTPVTNIYSTPNNAVADLAGSGCSFQTYKQKNEAPQMVAALEVIVKSICYNIAKDPNGATKYPGTQGHPPTISSIIGAGNHAVNSYHYKGCAADFAGGDPNFVNSAIGKAIIQEAKINGISPSRINPGSDATQTYHVHIDLGTSCPTNGGDPNVADPNDPNAN